MGGTSALGVAFSEGSVPQSHDLAIESWGGRRVLPVARVDTVHLNPETPHIEASAHTQKVV